METSFVIRQLPESPRERHFIDMIGATGGSLTVIGRRDGLMTCHHAHRGLMCVEARGPVQRCLQL